MKRRKKLLPSLRPARSCSRRVAVTTTQPTPRRRPDPKRLLAARHRPTPRHPGHRGTRRHRGTGDTEAPEDTEAPTTPRHPRGEAFAVDVGAATIPMRRARRSTASRSAPRSRSRVAPPCCSSRSATACRRTSTTTTPSSAASNGQQIELVIKDDQYTADLTKCRTSTRWSSTTRWRCSRHHRLAEQPGRPGRPQRPVLPAAVRRDRCTELGRRRGNPWTSGLLVPYEIESKVWADYVSRPTARVRRLRSSP